MTRQEKLSLSVAALICIGFTQHLYHTAGWLPTIIIGFGALTLGLVLWLKTSFYYPTDPNRLLPPYLMTAGLLMLHIAEEYAFDFGNRIAGITEGIWSTEMFLWSLGLGFPLVWISGGIAIAKRHPFGGFASCFLFCGMLLGEPTHLLIFPIREMLIHGGHYDYFPGMWTALMPLVSGLWGLVVIIQDSRPQKLGAATEDLKEAETQTP